MVSGVIGLRAGLVGPPFFAAIVLAQDWLRTDYNPVRQFISELAIGPSGWIQTVNFLTYGAILVLFALGARLESRRKVFRVGYLLLMIIGIAIFSGGLFVTDPAQTPFSQISWRGVLHLMAALVVFLLFPISCLVFYFAFRRESQWNVMRRLSMLSLIVILVTILSAYVPPSIIPSDIRSYGPWPGILNRVIVGMWLLWQFMLALSLYRRRSDEAQLRH